MSGATPPSPHALMAFMGMILPFYLPVKGQKRSQWPRGLRRGSVAARLLGLSVRIPTGGMDVCLL